LEEVLDEQETARAQGAEVVDVDDLPYPDCCVVSFGHEGYELKDELFRDVESAARRANELEDKGFSVVIRQSLYTQPQPAVPEGFAEDLRTALLEAWAGVDGQKRRVGHEWLDATKNRLLALLSTPTTPQADGWVRCEDRLPEPRRASRKAPNGILARHESGRITQFRDVTETLLQYMRNGPRKPTKFEQTVGERITEWMDLDAVQEGA
jgi:hypothetical protein